MHYLVTGGCGFIGSHLVRALLTLNHRVTVIDDLSMGTKAALPEGVSLIVADVLNEASVIDVMRNKVDGCFHLAAIPSVERCLTEWYRTSEVNVLGTVSVFEAARKAAAQPIPVVYASSAAVYGADHMNAIRETASIAPISSYGVDKFTCESYAKIAWQNYGLPNVGLRFFNVYGAGQPRNSPYSGVITCFMDAFEHKQPIRMFGDGEQTRDFIYVGDVANAMIGAMEMPNKSNDVYNVCAGKAISVKTMAETMAAIYGVTCEMDFQRARIGDIRHSFGNPDKLLQAVSMPALKSLKEGLTLTIKGQV